MIVNNSRSKYFDSWLWEYNLSLLASAFEQLVQLGDEMGIPVQCQLKSNSSFMFQNLNYFNILHWTLAYW